jgi:hypothetical protein
MGSSGGGSSKPPNQPTPAGQITGYGSASPFAPSYNSVLSNGMGWADVGEIDAANDANATAAQAQAAQAAQARAQAAQASASPFGATDAFAQRLLDYNKQQKFNQGMMSMGGPFARYGIGQTFGPNALKAPVASNPTEQLMMQALQQRAAGGGGTYRGPTMGGGGHLR